MDIDRIELSLKDSLSDITRKERRNLLLAASIGGAIGVMGLVPTKFSALGIEMISRGQQATFLYVMAAVIVYFMAAFVVYAMADYAIWKAHRWTSDEKYYNQWGEYEPDFEEAEAYDRMIKEVGRPPSDKMLSVVGSVRVAFDFGLPLLTGSSAVIYLIFHGMGYV